MKSQASDVIYFAMDIDLLSKMVKELILDNDRVVLPGLGCFVAEVVPAYFSDKGYTINPPYRKLYFRAKPDEGDGLIDFYAKTNGVTYEMAEKIVRSFVLELKTVLHTRKLVMFPGLGRLRATKENNIFFIADEDLDIYPEGFGLEPISLKTHQESREEVSVAVGGLKSILDDMGDVAVESDAVVQYPEVEPVSIPLAEPEPEPEPEPDSLVQPEPVIEEEVTGHTGPWKIVLAVLAAFVILVLGYMAVGRLFPAWIDGFLFSPEEIELLNK